MAAFARNAGATDGIEQAVADCGHDQSDAGANGEGQQSAGRAQHDEDVGFKLPGR